MTIRAALPRDAQDIAEIWNRMIRDTLSTFTTQEKTTDDIDGMIGSRQGGFWVAEQGGRVAGFVTFGSFRAGSGYAATVEHTILVSDHRQGTGVGRQLMQTAEHGARHMGHHVIVGGISHTNLAAQRFHQRLGYHEVARMPQVGFKSGQWLDLVLMQKIL